MNKEQINKVADKAWELANEPYTDFQACVALKDCAIVIKELQSRLESLEKDAARLEFVFSPDKYDHDGIVNLYLEILEGKKPDMSKVRASIDAAMKG